MEESKELLTICPCGKSTDCYNSDTVDFGQCFQCGLTKITGDVDFSKYPKLYKEVAIGNWYPFFNKTESHMIYLDGSCKEDAKYVFVTFDKDDKPVQSTRKEYDRNNFFELLKFANDGIPDQLIEVL